MRFWSFAREKFRVEKKRSFYYDAQKSITLFRIWG